MESRIVYDLYIHLYIYIYPLKKDAISKMVTTNYCASFSLDDGVRTICQASQMADCE